MARVPIQQALLHCFISAAVALPVSDIQSSDSYGRLHSWLHGHDTVHPAGTAAPTLSPEAVLPALPVFTPTVEKQIAVFAHLNSIMAPDSRIRVDQIVELPIAHGKAFQDTKTGVEGAVFLPEAAATAQLDVDFELDARIVGFRFMELSVKDVFTNAKIKLEPITWACADCAVHSGYLHAVNRLLPKLLEQFGKTQPIYLTGYSEGAGLALVLAAYLAAHGYDVQRVVTFAGARVGNVAFDGWIREMRLAARIWRVTYQRDPVVRAPPSMLGYRHTGIEFFIRCNYKHNDGHNRFVGDDKFHTAVCQSEDSSCGATRIVSGNPLDHVMCPFGLGVDLDLLGACKQCSGFAYGVDDSVDNSLSVTA